MAAILARLLALHDLRLAKARQAMTADERGNSDLPSAEQAARKCNHDHFVGTDIRDMRCAECRMPQCEVVADYWKRLQTAEAKSRTRERAVWIAGRDAAAAKARKLGAGADEDDEGAIDVVCEHIAQAICALEPPEEM